MEQTERRDIIRDIRLSRDAKARLNAGAEVRQFVLESAPGHADETSAERRRFSLDAERWTAFMAALDALPRPLPRLERLFLKASPFEASEPG
jgi:uncharacterized protein (DUF1778 family)